MFRAPEVNFYVQDVEACTRFYSEHFGFTEAYRTPVNGTPDHVELRLDGFTLGLSSIEAARRAHGLPAEPGRPPRGKIILWTDDVDRVYAELMDKGVRSVSEPHDFIGRLHGAWVADPDGNHVHIVQEIASGVLA